MTNSDPFAGIDEAYGYVPGDAIYDMRTETVDVPVFGTHTRECYERGWFDLDRESDCLRPATITRPLTETEQLDIEVRQERTQDAAS